MTDTTPFSEPASTSSGSSFYWAMKILPRHKRAAMMAIYGFCRVVDDIADGDMSPDAKMKGLESCRADIETLFQGHDPQATFVKDLVPIVRDFALDKADFLAVIDGMEMDASDTVIMPDEATFDLYIDRVACAVGRLSDRVFGVSGADADLLAHHLGRALQITNILRDLDEDAKRGRLYLPADTLAAHGINTGINADTPNDVLKHPNLESVLNVFAIRAHHHFDEASKALDRLDRTATRPARMMQAVYSRILDGLETRGLARIDRPVKFNKFKKLWLAIRYGVFG